MNKIAAQDWKTTRTYEHDNDTFDIMMDGITEQQMIDTFGEPTIVQGLLWSEWAFEMDGISEQYGIAFFMNKPRIRIVARTPKDMDVCVYLFLALLREKIKNKTDK